MKEEKADAAEERKKDREQKKKEAKKKKRKANTRGMNDPRKKKDVPDTQQDRKSGKNQSEKYVFQKQKKPLPGCSTSNTPYDEDYECLYCSELYSRSKSRENG